MSARPGGAVLLTGAGGTLGLGLARTRPPLGIALAGRRRPLFWGDHFHSVDLAAPGELAALVRQLRPRAVLHAAAMSRLADCEADPQGAARVNVEAVAELLEAAGEAGAAVVLVSTDQVFDGRMDSYAETDPPNPLHRYGFTKAAAEERVVAQGGTVARLPLLLGPRAAPGRQGADAAILASLAAGETPRLFADEVRAPAAAARVAAALWTLAEDPRPGVFHLAGAEAVSRYELGLRVCEAAGVEPALERARAAEIPGLESRPRRLVLTCERARRELRWEPPDLRESLASLGAADPAS